MHFLDRYSPLQSCRHSYKYLIILPDLKDTFTEVTTFLRVGSKTFLATEVFQVEVTYSARNLCLDIMKYTKIIHWVFTECLPPLLDSTGNYNKT